MTHQIKVTNLVSKLRYKLSDRRNLKNPEGPIGRHNKIRKTVTALFKYERIELNYHRGDECRGYAERLISEAIRHGDCHKPTMEVADYWLLEKQLIHKLFKVLAPRYQNYTIPYTKMWKAPQIYPGRGYPRCILELRGNIYPPLGEDKSYNKNFIHNVLLSEAKKAFEKEKAKKLLEGDKKVEKSPEVKSENVVMSDVNNKSGEETIKADDNVGDDSTEQTEVKSKDESLDKDIDLSKMTITEGKENVSSNKEKET